MSHDVRRRAGRLVARCMTAAIITAAFVRRSAWPDTAAAVASGARRPATRAATVSSPDGRLTVAADAAGRPAPLRGEARRPRRSSFRPSSVCG